MKRVIKGLIKFTRFREYVFTVVGMTLLGAKLAHGWIGFRLALVMLANLLTVCFAFMFNDLQDAPDDVLDAQKKVRNPVSSGELSYRKGLLICVLAFVASAYLYSFLSPWAFVTGMLNLLLAWWYSWRRVRFKSMPFLDIASHVLLLAGAQLMTAYYTFADDLLEIWPVVLAVFLSSAYGELWNELRDFEIDQKTNVRHTAAILGERWTKRLIMCLLLIAVSLFLLSVWMGLIPLWLIGMLLLVLVVYLILIKFKSEGSFVDKSDKYNLPALAMICLLFFVWFMFD